MIWAPESQENDSSFSILVDRAALLARGSQVVSRVPRHGCQRKCLERSTRFDRSTRLDRLVLSDRRRFNQFDDRVFRWFVAANLASVAGMLGILRIVAG